MRRLIIALAVACFPQAATADTTAFINVNVIDMTAELVREQQTVFVTDGVIASTGPVDAMPVPEGTRVIDGTDRYLIPGLAEMHARVPAADSADTERYFALFVANGVTTIRGILGQPSHLVLRDELRRGARFGPRLITAGPPLSGRSVQDPADGARQVREQQAAGYDFLTIQPDLARNEFAAIASTARELGIPFAGHIPAEVGVESAVEQGIATIDHLDGYMAALLPANIDRSGGFGGFFDVLLADQADAARIVDIVERTSAGGTWNVPTLSLIEQLINEVPAEELGDRAEMIYMPEATVEGWVEAKRRQGQERGFSKAAAARAVELRRTLVLALHQANGRILLGSDAPQAFNVPGFSTHHELEFLVAAGLTPFEALKAGTVNAAAFLGLDTGSIAAGRQADLVLLDANPLEDIANTRRIHGVMLRGEWHSRAELAQRIAEFRRANGS